MSLRHVLVALLLVGGLTACASDGPDASAGASSASPSGTSTAEPLPTGKSDLAVAAGTYLSPEGFSPALELQVPAGWTSVHRAADAFDLGKPDPERDAPLVAVVVMRPPQATAAEAVKAVRDAATGAVAPVVGDFLLGKPALGLDVLDGDGEVVSSADGGVALDAAAGQRLRVLAVDVGGSPLLVAVVVPDATRWDDAWPEAKGLLTGISAAA